MAKVIFYILVMPLAFIGGSGVGMVALVLYQNRNRKVRTVSEQINE